MNAEQRRFEETIVFVHHYGGSRKTPKRHMSFVNELGYNAVSFDMSHHHNETSLTNLPLTKKLKFGWRHVWANEIQSVLNDIPGNKILYSFSSPSSSAFAAICDRSAYDISAWVCDGGPFFDAPISFLKYVLAESSELSWYLKPAKYAMAVGLWGTVNYEKEMKELGSLIPRNFPVLSVRGWNDPLVSPRSIDAFFEAQSNLNLEVLSLPEGRHLDGMRKYPTEYKPRLTRFLKNYSKPI